MISDKNSNRTKALVFFFMFGIPFPYLFAEEVIQKPWDDNGSIVHLWSSFLLFGHLYYSYKNLEMEKISKKVLECLHL